MQHALHRLGLTPKHSFEKGGISNFFHAFFQKKFVKHFSSKLFFHPAFFTSYLLLDFTFLLFLRYSAEIRGQKRDEGVE